MELHLEELHGNLNYSCQGAVVYVCRDLTLLRLWQDWCLGREFADRAETSVKEILTLEHDAAKYCCT